MLLNRSAEFSFAFAYLFTLRLAGYFLWKVVVAYLHKAFIYVIIDGLSAKHLLTLEIIISQGLAYTGIYGDVVIEETIFYIGDEVKLV